MDRSNSVIGKLSKLEKIRTTIRQHSHYSTGCSPHECGIGRRTELASDLLNILSDYKKLLTQKLNKEK